MQLKPSPAAVLRDLTEQIEDMHADNKQLAGDLLYGYIECGGLLVRAKELVTELFGHGAWLGWIAANLTIRKRQVQKYMRAYDLRERLKAHPEALLSLDDCMEAVAEPQLVTVKKGPPEGEAKHDESTPSDESTSSVHLYEGTDPEPEIEEPEVEEPRVAVLVKTSKPATTSVQDGGKLARELAMRQFNDCVAKIRTTIRAEPELGDEMINILAGTVGYDRAGWVRRPKPRDKPGRK
jgi:hypothetical protein